MSKSEKKEALSQNDYWEVSHAAGRVTSYACSVSARHIRDGRMRLQFNREVAYYMRGIVRDVESGEKSVQQGLRKILEERRSLIDQSQQLLGLAAGVLQVTGGAAMCVGSVGALCAAGVFTAVHGMNNIYENGNNLWEHKTETTGPVRKSYQRAAALVGGNESDGNIVYGAIDIGLSGFSAFRKVPKPGAWRLWKYLDVDLVRSYRLASKPTLVIDAAATQITTNSLWGEIEKRINAHEQ
jgi:hypothetical protein